MKSILCCTFSCQKQTSTACPRPTPHCNSLRKQEEIRIAFQLNELRARKSIDERCSYIFAFLLLLSDVEFLFHIWWRAKPECNSVAAAFAHCAAPHSFLTQFLGLDNLGWIRKENHRSWHFLDFQVCERAFQLINWMLFTATTCLCYQWTFIRVAQNFAIKIKTIFFRIDVAADGKSGSQLSDELLLSMS